MNEDQVNIKFKVCPPLLGFMALWHSALLFPKKASDVLAEIPVPSVSLLNQKIKSENGEQISPLHSEGGKALCTEFLDLYLSAQENPEQKISRTNIDAFLHIFESDLKQVHHFSDQEITQLFNTVKMAYQGYKFFYVSALPKLKEQVETYQIFQNDPRLGYRQELDKIATFFAVPPQKITGFITPFVKHVITDGISYGNCFFINTPLVKNRDSQYISIKGRSILKKKIGVPFHEATQCLFSQSPLLKQIKDYVNNGKPAHLPLSDLIYIFQKHIHQNHALSHAQESTKIQEIFASVSDHIIRDKISALESGPLKSPLPLNKNLSAIDLVTPIFKEAVTTYMNENRSIDADFWNHLNISHIKQKLLTGTLINTKPRSVSLSATGIIQNQNNR